MTHEVPGHIEKLASAVVDAAYTVHRELGPGLLENVYEMAVCYELSQRGLTFERQVTMPVAYRDIRLDAGLRLDLIIEGELIVELKTVESLTDLHRAQLMTYLKLTGKPLGLLINFNVTRIKNGIRRIVMTKRSDPPPQAADAASLH